MHQAARPFQQLLSILTFFRKRLMLSLNRRNPSIVQVRLPASRRDFSFPFRRFPDFPSKARARVKKISVKFWEIPERIPDLVKSIHLL